MSAGEGRRELVHVLIAREPLGPEAAVGTAGWLQRLCRAAVGSLPAFGAAVSVMTEVDALGIVVASDARSEVIGELAFTVGEGPCLEAFATGRPVLAVDLFDGDGSRWPGYAPGARGQGVRAVFAFPLQVGAARLGTFEVYRDEPGGLSREALSQALAFAEVATMTVLDGQRQVQGSGVPAGLDDARVSRFEVYQAQGMVMAQLGVSLVEAMARLRGYAYAHDRRLGDVAQDIVERRLTLPSDEYPDSTASTEGRAS